jgi:hypothetical protein
MSILGKHKIKSILDNVNLEIAKSFGISLQYFRYIKCKAGEYASARRELSKKKSHISNLQYRTEKLMLKNDFIDEFKGDEKICNIAWVLVKDDHENYISQFRE